MVLSSWQASPNNTHTALQSTDMPGTTTQRDRWTGALLPMLTLHVSHQTYPEPLHRETDGLTPVRGSPNNAHTVLQSSDRSGATT